MWVVLISIHYLSLKTSPVGSQTRVQENKCKSKCNKSSGCRSAECKCAVSMKTTGQYTLINEWLTTSSESVKEEKKSAVRHRFYI